MKYSWDSWKPGQDDNKKAKTQYTWDTWQPPKQSTSKTSPPGIKKPGGLLNTLENIGSGVVHAVGGIIHSALTDNSPVNNQITVGKNANSMVKPTTQAQQQSSPQKVAVGKAGIVKVEPRQYSNADAFVTGALDSASLGLGNLALSKMTGNKEIVPKGFESAKNSGEIAGFMAPTSGTGLIAKGAEGLTKSIAKPAIQRLAQGAIVGGTSLGADEFNHGLVNTNAKKAGLQALKTAGLGVAGGAALDLGLSGLGKLLSRRAPTHLLEQIDNAKAPSEPILKPGSYNLKNTALESAQNAYNDAAEKVSDHYGSSNVMQSIKDTDSRALSNKIADTFDPSKGTGSNIYKNKIENILKNQANRTNLSQDDLDIVHRYYPELAQKYSLPTDVQQRSLFSRVKSDTGIDLRDYVKAMDEAKAPDLKTISDLRNKKYLYGVEDRKTPGLQKNTLDPNILSPDILSKIKQNALNVGAEGTPEYEHAFKWMKQRAASYLNSGTIPQSTMSPELKDAYSNIMYNNTAPKAVEGTIQIPNIVSGSRNQNLSLIDAALNKIHNAYTRLFDVNHPVNMIDNKGNYGNDSVKVMANNAKSAQSTVDHIINDSLVDMSGNKIGKGLNEIYGRINKSDIPLFDEYILHKHNIDRMKVGKPVFGFDITADDSAQRVRELDELHPEFMKVSGELNDFISKLSKEWGAGSGRVSNDLLTKLQEMYPNYVPVNRANDPSFEPVNDKKYVTSSGKFIKLATGGDSDIISPTETIKSYVSKTVKAARQNELYQSILNSVMQEPEKMKKLGISITDTGKDTLESFSNAEDMKDLVNLDQLTSDSKKGSILTVLKDGKPISLRINNPDVYKSLQDIKTGYVYHGIAKGSHLLQTPMKALITTSNPLFAVRNIARDIPTALVNTRNNPFTYTKNLVTGIKDMATDADLFQKYKALGGSSSNLSNDIDRIMPNQKPLRKFAEVSKTLGNNPVKKLMEASETLPRYAEFKSTVQKGGGSYGSLMQGIYDANDITTNFGRYGDITKTMDAGVPYLNAGVQGLDKLVRQFKDRPISSVLKGATVVSAPTLLFHEINKNNPYYQALDNRTKDQYYLLPNPGTGGKTFLKIPKAREIGVLFGSLLERELRAASGEKDAFKDFFKSGDGPLSYLRGNVANNFAPSNPFENNIATPIITNLASNKDFAGRTIVPLSMSDRSPRYQYDETTSSISKKLGDALNLSPKQLDYLMKSYLGVIGQLMIPATAENGNPAKAITSQFTSDPLYSNQAITDFYDNIDKLKRNAADRNFLEAIPSKAVTKEEVLSNRFTRAQKQLAEFSKKAAKAANDDEARQYRQKMIDLATKYNSKMQ